MRPIKRGNSPQSTDFKDYRDAKPHLVKRLGLYCSYCERRVVTNLAVEHIQPKGIKAYAALEGRWSNFLLACVNCNSTKKDKIVTLRDECFPDRDNTYLAFEYRADGSILPHHILTRAKKLIAKRTLSLTGLDKKTSAVLNENDEYEVLDRYGQRLEVWGIAEDAKATILEANGSVAVKKMAVFAALGHGHFSIWMTVFSDDSDMTKRIVSAFSGTTDSGCFDAGTGAAISPGANPDGLAHGGKF